MSPWLLTLILTFLNIDCKKGHALPISVLILREKNGHCFAVYLEQKIYSIIVLISLPALYPSFITFLWQAFCDGHHFNALFCCFGNE